MLITPSRATPLSCPSRISGQASVPPVSARYSSDSLLQAEKRSGVAAEHIPLLLQFAQEKEVIFGFRHVEPAATVLIKRGMQTKNFNIKGKSSNWGPMAGYIPVNQDLSKLCGEPKSVEQGNKDIQESLGKPGIYDPLNPLLTTTIDKQALTLDEVQMNAWKRDPNTRNPKQDGDEFRATCDYQPRAQERDFIATPAEYSADKCVSWRIDEFDSKTELRRPVEIIGYTSQCMAAHGVSKRAGFWPITADYDLLMVAQKWEKFGPSDCDITDNDTLGRVNPELAALIPEMNGSIGWTFGVSDAQILVHHGADTENPKSVMSANFPAIFFIPGHDGPQLQIIETGDEYKEFLNGQPEFAMPWNRKWKLRQTPQEQDIRNPIVAIFAAKHAAKASKRSS